MPEVGNFDSHEGRKSIREGIVKVKWTFFLHLTDDSLFKRRARMYSLYLHKTFAFSPVPDLPMSYLGVAA